MTLPKIAIFEEGDHAINVLEISHWSLVPTLSQTHGPFKELVVWMKNGKSVHFSGRTGHEVEKRLKDFMKRWPG